MKKRFGRNLKYQIKEGTCTDFIILRFFKEIEVFAPNCFYIPAVYDAVSLAATKFESHYIIA